MLEDTGLLGCKPMSTFIDSYVDVWDEHSMCFVDVLPTEGLLGS